VFLKRSLHFYVDPLKWEHGYMRNAPPTFYHPLDIALIFRPLLLRTMFGTGRLR